MMLVHEMRILDSTDNEARSLDKRLLAVMVDINQPPAWETVPPAIIATNTCTNNPTLLSLLPFRHRIMLTDDNLHTVFGLLKRNEARLGILQCTCLHFDCSCRHAER